MERSKKDALRLRKKLNINQKKKKEERYIKGKIKIG